MAYHLCIALNQAAFETQPGTGLTAGVCLRGICAALPRSDCARARSALMPHTRRRLAPTVSHGPSGYRERRIAPWRGKGGNSGHASPQDAGPAMR